MKRNLWMLLISLLIPMLSFSQTISRNFPKITEDSLIVITPLELKKTNLIFVEHSQLKHKIPLLEETIDIQNSSIRVLNDKQSNLSKQISYLKTINNDNLNTISNLNKQVSVQKNRNKKIKKIVIGSISINIGLLIVLFATK